MRVRGLDCWIIAFLAVVAMITPLFGDQPTTVSPTHRRYLAVLSELNTAGIPTSTAQIYPAVPVDGRNAAPIYIGEMTKLPETQLESESRAVLRPTSTAEDWKNAETFVATSAKLIDAVHRVASMPVCAVAGRSNSPDPAAVLYPELDEMRRAARVIAIQSMVMSHEGKSIEAIGNAALGFRISSQAYQDHILICWNTGSAIDSVTFDTIEQIMASNETDLSLVRAAEQVLNENWHLHPVTEPLRGETAVAIGELTVVRRASPQELARTRSDDRASSDITRAAMSRVAWSDFIDRNAIVIGVYFESLVADAGRPYPDASRAIGALEADVASNDRGDHTFSHILLPVFTDCVGIQARIEAKVSLVRASAALFAYRSAHGSYPGSLDQAMADVPVDPYDLKPIGYRPDGAGFVLYSVGKTGQYAGGTPVGFESVLRVSGDGIVAWK